MICDGYKPITEGNQPGKAFPAQKGYAPSSTQGRCATKTGTASATRQVKRVQAVVQIGPRPATLRRSPIDYTRQTDTYSAATGRGTGDTPPVRVPIYRNPMISSASSSPSAVFTAGS